MSAVGNRDAVLWKHAGQPKRDVPRIKAAVITNADAGIAHTEA